MTYVAAMPKQLSILIVEDSPDDALLVERQISGSGCSVKCERVETAEAMELALAGGTWDAVIADCSLPEFSAVDALRLAQLHAIELPFIVVSGTIGETTAVELMRAGAHDYVMKGDLHRLVPALERELREAETRRDRRAMEAELRNRERRYRAVVEQSADGIILLGSDGRFLEANLRAAELMGCERHELVDLKVGDLLPLKIGSDPRALEVFSNGRAFRVDHDLPRKDGSRFPAEVTARLLDEHLLITIHDISARKKTEHELALRARQQAAIATLGQSALAATGLKSLMREACSLSAIVLEVDFAQVVERRWNPLRGAIIAGHGWPPEIIELETEVRADSHVCRAASEGRPVVFEYLASDLSLQGSPLLAEHGIVSGAAVVIGAPASLFGVLAVHSRQSRSFSGEDVAFLQSLANVLADAIDRKKREDAMLASEKSLAEAQRIAGLGSWSWDLASGDIIWSDQTFSIFGLQPGSAAIDIERFYELVHSDDRDAVARAVAAALEGEEYAAEYRVMRPDGELRVLQESAEVVRDATGRPTRMVGIVHDVTDRKRAEAERLLLQAELEQANRLNALGRMAASIAHEVNNVLMGIQPFAEIIARSPSGETLARASRQIALSVQRGRKLTQEILRFTRPQEPVIQNVSIARWLDGFASEARLIVPPAVEIEFCHDASARSVAADPHQLSQIFTNLLINAHDAVGECGRIRVAVDRLEGDVVFSSGVVRDAARYAHFVVTDDGCGISPDDLPRLFEPFFTTKRGGTGLGLSISYQAVLRHEGYIYVESDPGEHTSFHVFLPLAEGEGGEVEAAPAGSMAEGGHAVKRLLLVEDEEAVSMGLAALLELEGIDVTVAPTGERGLAELEQRLPDVVILDVGLPDMNGVDLYETIAKRWPSLPVIFSTGHEDKGRIDAAGGGAAVGFLLKPYGVDELLTEIARVCSSQLTAD